MKHFPNSLTTLPRCSGAMFPKEQALGHTLSPAEHVQVYVTIFLKIATCSWLAAKRSPTDMGLPRVFTGLFLICCSFCQQTLFFINLELVQFTENKEKGIYFIFN